MSGPEREDVVSHIGSEREDVVSHIGPEREDVVSHIGPEREDVVSHISFDFLTSWFDWKCMFVVPGSSELCSGSGSETGLKEDSTPEGWIMFSLGLVTGSVITLKVWSFSELSTSLESEKFCSCLDRFPGSVTRFSSELFIFSSP